MSDARDTDVQRLVDLLQDSQSKSLTPEDMKQLRYAIYARKSTTSEDRQASSIEDQVKECIEQPNRIFLNSLSIIDEPSVSAPSIPKPQRNEGVLIF